MNRTPPRIATTLLGLILSAEEREFVLGDLAEEFFTEKRSNLWYWRQAMESSVHLAWRSFEKQGLAMLAGGAVMAAGVLLLEIAARGTLPVFPRVQPLIFAFTMALLATGILAAVAGGYIATKVAGRTTSLATLLLGILFLAITGAWLLHGIGAEAPTWFRGGMILLVLPSAYFGRHLRSKRTQRA
jgi:hypothetical protein